MLRQLEFALFDFTLHAGYDPARGARVSEVLAEVRAKVSVVPVPAWNRFAHSFGHIFAGRLRRRLLQLQMGRGAGRGCLCRIRGSRCV